MKTPSSPFFRATDCSISHCTQGGVTSPGTNPLGLVMSNAAELKLGEK